MSLRFLNNKEGVFMGKKIKSNAFTLAEVLITLGITGVIAAMTLPQLIKNYKEKVLLQQAKKMYSVISNALVAYSNDMGTPGEYWLIFDGSQELNDIVKDFSKYISPIQICQSEDIRNSNCGGGSYTIRTFKRKNNGQGKVSNLTHIMVDSGRMVLKDGSFVSIIKDNTSSGTCFYNWTQNVTDENGFNTGETIARTSTRCGRIYFDVNGLKGPNQYGNDVFEIQVHAKKISASDSLEHTGGLNNAIITDQLEKGEIYDTNADY